MKTKGQAAEAAARAVESFQQQGAQLQAEYQGAEKARQTALQHFQETITELSQSLLPQASMEYLTKLEQALQATFLVGSRQGYEQRRPQWVRRLAELEQDPEFQQREDLLRPPHGQLLLELARLIEQNKSVDERLGQLEGNRNMAWILKRLPEPGARRSVFSSFWRAITLAETREKRAQTAAAKELGYTHWDELSAEYQRLVAQSMDLGNQVVAVNLRRQNLQTLIAEHADTHEWVHNFEARLALQLQGSLAGHLTRADLRALHPRLTGPAQLLTAQADALKHKDQYFQNMADFLKAEIGDRAGRAEKISRVRALWRRRPSDRLGRDQSKWLIAGPQAKHESTRKQLVWLGTVRAKIAQFSDYSAYHRYLCQDPQMLAYDVFGFATPERMPHEGFTLALFAMVRNHRSRNRQKGPDYSSFKQCDREERLRQREEARQDARRQREDEEFRARQEVQEIESDSDDDWRDDSTLEDDQGGDYSQPDHHHHLSVGEVAAGVVVGLAVAEVIHEGLEAQMNEGS